ncbi:SDR family NAD(P)-dependent oxidoreductase [Martelella alba]|uniref:SDR family oxidoreductase n=1 Tax=Martelella alba TaxID=2590451 RepID=A0ABY2SK71_9HYPH|nr:SDR family oxidoreductase [Martelella alba]TKI03628.1 SDR family oxidoreductase [Martelella alba]
MSHKIAVITGASRGLGKSMARHLVRQGVDIIGTYRHRADEARSLADDIMREGGKAAMLQLDVGDSAGFAEFAVKLGRTLAHDFQRDQFDYLANNAGVGLHAPFAQTTMEQFDLMYNVHLKGPYFLTQTLLPLIADQGRILNISSGLARFTFPGSSAYAIMKGGIEVFTRYLAKELGERRISVNTLAPGAIETDFSDGMVRDNKALNQQIASITALGRAGLPDDIGGAAAALLADASQWINGQRIEASGGTLL